MRHQIHKAPSMAFGRKRHTIHHNHVDRTSAIPLQNGSSLVKEKTFAYFCDCLHPSLCINFTIKIYSIHGFKKAPKPKLLLRCVQLCELS